MGVFCDRLNLCSTAALSSTTGLDKTKADIAKKSSHSYSSRWTNATHFFTLSPFFTQKLSYFTRKRFASILFYAPNYRKRRRDATNFAIRIMTMWWTFLDAGKRKVFKSKVTSFHICDLVRILQYVSKTCSLKLEMLFSQVFASLL